MKQLLYMILILTGTALSAQERVNRFEQAEYTEASPSLENIDGSGQMNPTDSGGGNAADPTPIDDYIPFLVIAAMGLIAYKAYKKTPTA